MWRKYFKLKGIRPGEVIHPRHGSIDFRRDDLDPDFLLKLWEEDFRYLELTKEGERHFFGLHQGEDEDRQGNAFSQQEFQDAVANSLSPQLSAKELCEAIEQAETIEEAEKYYHQGSHYKTVQEAYQKKIDSLDQGYKPKLDTKLGE